MFLDPGIPNKELSGKRGFSIHSSEKKKSKLVVGNGGVLTVGSHMHAQALNPPQKSVFLKKLVYS